MNKVIKSILSAFLALSLAACSGSKKADPEAEVRSVIKDFFTGLQTGDLEKCAGYVDSDSSEALDTLVGNLEDAASGMTSLFGKNADEEAEKSIEAFTSGVISKAISEYEVKEISKISDTEYSCAVGIGLLNSDSFRQAFSSLNLNEYTSSLSAEYVKIAAEQGEEAGMAFLYKSILKYMNENIDRLFENAQYEPAEIKMNVEKKDDAWKITKIKGS